jgi:hypothetical protein
MTMWKEKKNWQRKLPEKVMTKILHYLLYSATLVGHILEESHWSDMEHWEELMRKQDSLVAGQRDE